MKKTTALYVLTAIATFSFASQSFAKGGSMGGGQGHGGTHQMASTMLPDSGNDMQQRTMLSNTSQKGSAVGTGQMNRKQSSTTNSAGHKHGNGTGTTPPVTTSAI